MGVFPRLGDFPLRNAKSPDMIPKTSAPAQTGP
jgi:hypothetical protein